MRTKFMERFQWILYHCASSDRELAKRIGCSRNQIWRWKTGMTLPNAEWLVRISKASGRSVDWLLGLDH